MTTDHAASGPREPVLEVRGLTVEFLVDGAWVPAARDVGYDVRPGEVLAVVGESGSGKTQSALALVGLLPPTARVRGSARLAGRELLGLDHRGLRAVRGREVAVVFQEPATALNPVYTVGFQIVETIRAHTPASPRAARARAVELLRTVDLPDPATAVDRYPHQLSGGQRQRVLIAQALACEPRLLIADEPTTALDVTVQAEILSLLRDLRHRVDAGILLITHDMGVVADLADRVLVMQDGRVVETGTVAEVLGRPQHPGTRRLLAAVPHLGSRTGPVEPAGRAGARAAARVPEPPGAVPAPVGADPVGADPVGADRVGATPAGTARPDAVPAALRATGLVVDYPARRRVPAVRAVDGLDLTVGAGEVLGLVGESGSGKSTVGRAAVGLLPVAGGSLAVGGTELAGIRRADLRAVRRGVSIVFQDPGSSLDPRLPVGESVGEPLRIHRAASGAALHRRVEELLDRVHLPRALRNRYPHELSGGQRQRIGIARALALRPRLLVADEPTSALDVSVQARVLELFRELQREDGFACLFITHDLAVVEVVADRVAVLRAGRLVEEGPRDRVLRSPRAGYTRALLAAVPVPDPAEQRRRRTEREGLRAGEAGAGSRPPG